ncbi:hypothetical protein [Pyruvatibacter sp.]|uniref:hypothetical protein n=1 Tax=Pyruvatibacter sp. TaxID=1981328 RepID=UPI0032ECC99D
MDIEPTQPPDDGSERRLHDRAARGALAVDLGFGEVDVLDWSYGGARIAGTSLALHVGDFATGTIAINATHGAFIADVVRVDPPYYDPRHPPTEISLRWLDLPADVLTQMIAVRSDTTLNNT